MFGRTGSPMTNFKFEEETCNRVIRFFHAVIYYEIKIKKVVLYGFCQPVQPFLLVCYFAAITSISQSTPLGMPFTATQLRAGLPVKYFA